MAKRDLTDEELRVLFSYSTTAARHLAKRLGVTPPTINAWRKRLRDEQWACRVQYADCARCGRVVTYNPEHDCEDILHSWCADGYRRPRRKRRPWTEEEDALLRDPRLTLKEVAQQVGKPYGSISARLHHLRKRDPGFRREN